jgi:hypothetical protein
MSVETKIPIHELPTAGDLPPLEPGDHLSRDEFERRFEATPGLTKAELLEGVVYTPPAVRAENHGGPHADLVACLVVYRAETPGLKVYIVPAQIPNRFQRLFPRVGFPQPFRHLCEPSTLWHGITNALFFASISTCAKERRWSWRSRFCLGWC